MKYSDFKKGKRVPQGKMCYHAENKRVRLRKLRLRISFLRQFAVLCNVEIFPQNIKNYATNEYRVNVLMRHE